MIMDYSKIGKIQNTHGLNGRIILKHIFEGKNIFKELNHVFIEVNRASYIPFFIKEKKVIDATEVLIQFDEVDSVEDARELLNKGVFIENEIFKKLKPKNVTEDFIGFWIIDKKLGRIGKVDDLYETPAQVVASVQYKEKEILIPLIEYTIISINVAKKEIFVELPEGLIEVYLGNERV